MVSFKHTFTPSDPPSERVIKARINAETGRTCSAVRVNWLANPGEVEVWLDEEATGQDLDDITAIVESTDPLATSALFRADLCRRIDEEMRQRAGAGFEFPAQSGKFYSCTVCSQINTNRQHWRQADLIYPWPVATVDNSEITMLADADAMESFSDASAANLEALLYACRIGKKAVIDAEDDPAAQAAFDAYMAG